MVILKLQIDRLVRKYGAYRTGQDAEAVTAVVAVLFYSLSVPTVDIL